jgi:serine/threonine protein kinase
MVEMFENPDQYSLVLEYLEGLDLYDYCNKRNFKIGEKKAKEIVFQVALGLEHMHMYGIVHRDIKLENIMMTDDTELASPKITDFGESAIVGPNEILREICGTVGYIAPEVL